VSTMLAVRITEATTDMVSPQGWKSASQRVVVGSILLSLKYFNAPGWYGTP
jgi:hypothetical protein